MIAYSLISHSASQRVLAFRRSIYAAVDIAAGEVFTAADVTPFCSFSSYEQLLARAARQAYQRGTPLSLDQLL